MTLIEIAGTRKTLIGKSDKVVLVYLLKWQGKFTNLILTKETKMWDKIKEFFKLTNGDLICAFVSIRNDTLTTALFLGIIGGLSGLF